MGLPSPHNEPTLWTFDVGYSDYWDWTVKGYGPTSDPQALDLTHLVLS
jgi:hypothetical protein